jgi:hypothetical protein
MRQSRLEFRRSLVDSRTPQNCIGPQLCGVHFIHVERSKSLAIAISFVTVHREILKRQSARIFCVPVVQLGGCKVLDRGGRCGRVLPIVAFPKTHPVGKVNFQSTQRRFTTPNLFLR